jgi:hypothetical protein
VFTLGIVGNMVYAVKLFFPGNPREYPADIPYIIMDPHYLKVGKITAKYCTFTIFGKQKECVILNLYIYLWPTPTET